MISDVTVSLTFADRYLEDALTIHDNVHACELTPDLCEDADMKTVDHVGFEEFHIARISVVAFELAHVFNLLEFALDKAMVAVAFTVNESEDIMTFFPTVASSEPTGRLWREEQSDEENHGRNHLEAPRQAEGCIASDEAAAVADVEHDEDSPGDGPLLCADDEASFGWWCKLRNIDRDLG